MEELIRNRVSGADIPSNPADLVDTSVSRTLKTGTFRSQVAWTLTIQGTGAILSLLTVVWLGVTLGPVQQGIFSRTRTEILFLASFAAFGLPQPLLYFVTSRSLSLSRAFRISLVTAGIGGVSAVVYTTIRDGKLDSVALLLALAVVGLVWHGNLRSVLLGVSSSTRFNLVTALPQLLVFVFVCLFVAFGSVNVGTTSLAFFCSFVAAGSLALVWIVRSERRSRVRSRQAVGLQELLAYGGASWLAAVCSNLSILACTLYVSDQLGARSLGVFTAGMVIAQTALTPLNYMLPLFFKHWMTHANGVIAFRSILRLAAFPLVAAGCAALAHTFSPISWLGAYRGLIGIAWIVLLGVAAEVMIKLLSVAAYVQGRPWRAALAEIARVVTALTLLWALGGDLGIDEVAGVWSMSAFFGACALAASTRFPYQLNRWGRRMSASP